MEEENKNNGKPADGQIGQEESVQGSYRAESKRRPLYLIAALLTVCFLGYLAANRFTAAPPPANSPQINAEVTKQEHGAGSGAFIAADAEKWAAYNNNQEITEAIIPDGVASIGHEAFSGCVNLKSVQIPDSVVNIEDYAFSGCSGLESIKIPDKVTSIKECTFSDCKNLKEIIIPDSVTHIGTSAFGCCSGLQEVVMSNKITSISKNAFDFCFDLKKITYKEKTYSSLEDFYKDVQANGAAAE